MKITIVQPDTIWEDKKANFIRIGQMLENLPGSTDIIVLPEMFNTGFSLDAEELSEKPGEETFKWMNDQSAASSSAICGSYIIRSGSDYYNRFLFVSPEQMHEQYDKRHLFGMAGENRIFTAGKSRKVFEYMGFRILPIICYDLRFPVWIRNRGDYDLIICVASWPDTRREAWNSLLKARAIENQCYVAGVNRAGRDGEGLSYAGDSVVLDPLGKVIAKINEYEEGMATAEISLKQLREFRERFPVWQDSDNFTLDL
jgi:omega-amidase